MRCLVLLAALLAGGCVALPKERSAGCAETKRPEIRLSPDGRTASMRLDVLTYNVEGLPRMIRSGRRDPLREMGERLADLRRRGEGPDIVMFQEVFSRRARRAVLAAGYPSLAPGPSHYHRPPSANGPRLPGRKNPRKGELGFKFASSGLLIAAEFPLLETARLPFARGSCAGRDCLANKGIAFARIAIPGVPAPVDLYTTHMNSTGASRVPEPRHLVAHNKQAREIGDYVARNSPPDLPIILGGDFNMRGSPDRFEHFIRLHTLKLVHTYCLANSKTCDVRISWDGDEPWMDTQDLQLFTSGPQVRVRPVLVEAMFDGSLGSPRLSDHDGFRVVYELSWSAAMTRTAPCEAESLAFLGDSTHMRGGSRADGVVANPVRSGRKQP
jgi:endonuclease/exonuclease/phosphatase family metal-dependent hydrolase